MDDFRSALLHCGLIDIGFHGNIFTWNNGQPRVAFVQERFPQSQIYHIQSSYLHHNQFLSIHRLSTRLHIKREYQRDSKRSRLPTLNVSTSSRKCGVGRDLQVAPCSNFLTKSEGVARPWLDGAGTWEIQKWNWRRRPKNLRRLQH